MTIENDLTYLKETKSLIKQAIISKGQEISETDTFRSYVDKIHDIVGNSIVIEDINTVQNLLSAEYSYQMNIPSGVTVLSNWLYEYEINNGVSYSEGAESILSLYISSVVIPSTVTHINAYALSCFDAVTIWIPSSVTTIDSKAFGDVSYDTSFITIYTDAPESIGWSGSLPAHVTVNYNSTYDEFLTVTKNTATIKFVASANGSCITDLSVTTTTPDGLERTDDVTVASLESSAESIEVPINSVITLVPSGGTLPDTCKIYTDSALTNLIYDDTSDSDLADFSYTVTRSVTFYIDAQFSGAPEII